MSDMDSPSFFMILAALLIVLALFCLYMTGRSRRSFERIQIQGDPEIPAWGRGFELCFHGLFPKGFRFLAWCSLAVATMAMLAAALWKPPAESDTKAGGSRYGLGAYYTVTRGRP